ncbi:hypothetical protein NDU88_001313 [Pleurodeles waltl]|uniref:Uncharacterized protein n=1 Tax=Pleurodeles waltl TaxID=8319 RepID=A0AAV7UTP8_PLEWA|nr:hypothetical protein NDU88_001313 [Pleurodeles waltl]
MATTQDSIKPALQDFYSTLYPHPLTNDTPQLVAFPDDANLPQLSSLQTAELDVPLRLEEIRPLISQLARNRAPGADGLPIEYYAMYSVAHTQLLLNAYNEACSRGKLTNLQREALVIVLPKPGHNPTNVVSYSCCHSVILIVRYWARFL